MAGRFYDTFTPSTDIGRSLNRLSSALFSGGPTPLQQEEVKIKKALSLAQQRHYESTAAKADMETGLLRRQANALDSTDALVRGLSGLDAPSFDLARDADTSGDSSRLSEYLTGRLRNDFQVPAAPVAPTTAEGSPVPRDLSAPKVTTTAKAPAENVDAVDAMRRYRAGRAASETLSRMGPNALHDPRLVQEVYSQSYAQQVAQDVGTGRMTHADGAALIATMLAKPQFKATSKGMTYNEYTGAPGETNPQIEAEVATLGAEKGERDAKGRLDNAKAAEQEQLNNAWMGALADPEKRAGYGETMAASKGQGIYGATSDTTYNRMTGKPGTKLPHSFAPREPRQPKEDKPRKLSAQEIKMAGQQFAGYLDQVEEGFTSGFDGKLPPEQRARITARAMQLFQDPDSEHYGNAAAALEATIGELAPEGFEEDFHLFSPNTVRPKAGAKAAAPAAPAQAAPSGQALPQPKTKEEYDRLPAGAQYIGTDGKKKVKKGGT